MPVLFLAANPLHALVFSSRTGSIYTIYLAASTKPGDIITAVNFKKIQEIVEATSETYTILKASGFWGGKGEETAVIVIALANDKKAAERIKACCKKLHDAFQNFSILCEFSKGIVLGVGALERAKDNVIETALDNTERTDWAKKVIDAVKNKTTQKELNRKHAIPKLAKLKNAKPDAKIEDGLELLKNEFPKLTRNTR